MNCTYEEVAALTLEECARNGAAKLDEILPGWEKKIDLERYRHLSPDRCILGQLGWHLFDQMRKRENGTIYSAEFYGILPVFPPNGEDGEMIIDRYRRQEMAWRFEIAKRLAS